MFFLLALLQFWSIFCAFHTKTCGSLRCLFFCADRANRTIFGFTLLCSGFTVVHILRFSVIVFLERVSWLISPGASALFVAFSRSGCRWLRFLRALFSIPRSRGSARFSPNYGVLRGQYSVFPCLVRVGSQGQFWLAPPPNIPGGVFIPARTLVSTLVVCGCLLVVLEPPRAGEQRRWYYLYIFRRNYYTITQCYAILRNNCLLVLFCMAARANCFRGGLPLYRALVG